MIVPPKYSLHYVHPLLIKKSRSSLHQLLTAILIYFRIVRDQANKTFDIYVQRIRKYGTTLPDSVLPPPTTTNGANAPRMGTPQKDTGWAGWAISSFTNKIGAANGEIQPKQPTLVASARPAIGSATTSGPPSNSASASNLQRQALTSTQPSISNTLVFTRTSTDHLFAAAQTEDDDLDDAWGEMDNDGNTFFDAPTTENTTRKTAAAQPAAAAFDDGGEPDFEGWLKAQAMAKKGGAGKGLPKGLAPKSTGASSKPNLTRGTTTGSVGQGQGTKKLAESGGKVGKVIDTKPREEEDDWGDAWD